MPEEYLQAAFEIKASCDEISRRILRWHWESKPGGHGFDALLEHVRRRQEESPAYYGHMPDVGRKTSWQQLDTTLCMRVLLDPENDAAQPLDLLGNTAHPGAARRACNAVRTARNEAAHASDRSSGGQAAILFDEAVECVEEGTLFHFHENPNPSCPAGRNIHRILDGRLEQVQAAMERELAGITLADVMRDADRCVREDGHTGKTE